MVSKLKVLAPFALIAMTLTSCGYNGELKSRIKRVEYEPITGDTLPEQVHNALNSIFGAQTELENNMYRLRLLDEGSINTTLEIALKGLISHNELHMNDFNIASKTNYSMSWNLDKHYAEFKADGKSSYIVFDPIADYYYYAYSYSVDGEEKKERVPMSLYSIEDYKDYIRSCLKNRGSFFGNVDLGLSGLGYNPAEYIFIENKPTSIEGVFHGEGLYKAYDYLNEKAGNGHSLTYKVATNGDGTFSGDLTAHLDLKTLKDNLVKDIPEELREFIEPILTDCTASGNLDFDLFAAWDKNYICQQEYIIKTNDLHFAKSIDEEFVEFKVSGDAYFGEEVTQQFDVTDETIRQILEEYDSI